MHKKIFFLVIIVIIISAIVMAIIILREDKKGKIDIAFPVYSDIANTIFLNGNIFPKEEIEVKSYVSGIVDTVYVSVGDQVIIGQPIARIKIVPDPIEIDAANSNLRLANITLEREQKNYERELKLYNSNVISKSEFEYAKNSYEISREQQTSAQNKLNRLLDVNPSGHVKSQNMILSTTNGMVIDIPIERGGSVVNRSSYSSGTSIATIANIDFKKEMLFKARIAESDLYLLKEHQPISIVINAAKKDTINTFISKIYPKGYFDQGITKYKIECLVSLEKLKTPIYYGYSAVAQIEVEKHYNVLIIEQKFLKFKHDTTIVEVLNKVNEIESRIIKTGISDGISIEVLKGLSIKDKLIIPQ